MSSYQLTAEAENDLFGIWTFIATDDPHAADRVEADLYKAFAFLALNPTVGRLRPDITALPVRFWILPRFSNYLVVYDPATRPIKIVRILHGARNLPRELRR